MPDGDRRRHGRHYRPPLRQDALADLARGVTKKSVEGSVAFVFFAFLASFLFVALFQITGLTTLAPFAVAPTLLLISVVTAIAELVDFGDDNLNVPLCAAALSILLL